MRWEEDNRKSRPDKLLLWLPCVAAPACEDKITITVFFTLTPIALQPSKMIS